MNVMIKNILKLLATVFVVALVSFTISSCKKEASGKLGALPSIDFEAVPSAGNPNEIIFVNKSSSAIIPYWKIGSSSIVQGDSVRQNFIFEGTYKATLYGAGQGGIDSLTKEFVIAKSDPEACVGTQLGFITSCTSKTWKLNPAAGTYKVGDAGPGAGNWWTSPATEVDARPCEFNDTYTFSFDANGTFVYDNKGDFYGDSYLGDNSAGCQPTSNYTEAQKGWGSGTFKFSFAANKGVKGLGQLTLIGNGAHIGIQKARNGGEITTGPANSITYDVLEAIHDPAGYDLLTVGVNIGGTGWWSFTLRSY